MNIPIENPNDFLNLVLYYLELKVAPSNMQRVEVSIVVRGELLSIFTNHVHYFFGCALDFILVAHVISDKSKQA